ncbi:hypothetical protein [Pantoea sp. BAV 3049]|uniref:hypothetical protein n=1 Tax=Pantoea sp. BAV 3049 TaxID=2654188 RepID=UPI00131EB2D1|nr:hypothetical protein [Pantoea sp. BAV 3049]
MRNLSSSPAFRPVIYTIEHVSTVPLHQWHAFVLAVTETFWQLPVRLRPGNTYLPSLNRAADLFPVADVMAFCGDTGENAWLTNMTIGRQRNCNTLSIQELDFQHQPCDFFARIVMVLLHNLCPDSFRIHSSDEGRSWALPLRWIEQHLGLSEQLKLTPPQPVLKTPVSDGAFDSLLLQLLSGGERVLSNDDWNAFTKAEFQLYELKRVAEKTDAL